MRTIQVTRGDLSVAAAEPLVAPCAQCGSTPGGAHQGRVAQRVDVTVSGWAAAQHARGVATRLTSGAHASAIGVALESEDETEDLYRAKPPRPPFTYGMLH